MPHAAPDHFDEENDEPDPEGPDASDIDDSDDAETVPCPYCRKPIHEQTDICPHCGSFISFQDAPRRQPGWIWAGAILGLIGMLWWVFA
jgi:hypothetical protein